MRASDDKAPRRIPHVKSVVGASVTMLAVTAVMAACSSSGNKGDACNGLGCDCPTEGATIECGETKAVGADSVTCHKGVRTCGGGKWGACVGSGVTVQSLKTKGTAPAKCTDNPCDPGCMSFDDGPGDLTSDGGLVVGEGGISLGEGGVWDAGSTCVGLQCAIDPCGGFYEKTQLTGQVFDPAGKNPLYNVLVYVPNAALTPLTEGVSCDSCATPSGSPIVSALTDYTGTFTLKGVPSGTSIPLVIQSGKWRRELTIPAVTKCVSNATNGLTGADGLKLIRFPKNRSEGNIPRFAFVSGWADPFECLFAKMGMDVSSATSEVGVPYVSSSLNPDRIHYYNSPATYSGDSYRGQDLSSSLGGPAPSANSLWDTAAHLNQYDAVILACEGREFDKGTTYNTNIANYAAIGGRVFATHWSYSYLQYAPVASQWPAVVNWNHTSAPVNPMTTLLNRTFPKGEAFAQWLSYVGASPTLGQLAIAEGRHDYDYVDRTRATPWMYSNSDGTLPTPLLAGGSPCATGAECASGVCLGAVPAGIILNGGFESGLTSWTASGGAVTTSTTAHGGTRSLQLGSTTTRTTDNSVSQTFNAPAGGGLLSFWFYSDCNDTVSWDWATATLLDNTTGITTTVLPRTCTTTPTWTPVTAVLVASHNYTLTLSNHDDYFWADPSATLFDDVEIVSPAGTCAPGSTVCTVDTDCPSGGTAGAGCWNGTCVPPHAQEALMTFNVPIGVAPASQCGRVVYSDFHVSATALVSPSGSPPTGSTFPGGCKAGDLSAQEKALEFMLFDLTSCILPDYVPPSAPPLVPATVTRDYTATCGLGERPVWHFFDWKTNTPGDSKIEFKVQTGDNSTEVTAMTPLLLATVSGPPVTTWTGADVAPVLTAGGVATNKWMLRVNMTLYPASDGTTSPTLVDWRLNYTCTAWE